MDQQLEKGLSEDLIWLPQRGYGYISRHNIKRDYFDEYVEKSKTIIGHKINKSRVDLVNNYTNKIVIDIGIGSGAFIEARTYKTLGYDIDAKSVSWLIEKSIFCDVIVERSLPSLCFWDSLEHIEEPEKLLSKVKVGCYVFISIPVFRNAEHVLYSKHFKPSEHCWYFTWKGLIQYMEGNNFKYIESNEAECALGREDICSFVFQK